MKILILTEGGIGIGFGHITRCLALVEICERLDKATSAYFLINGDDSINKVLNGKKYGISNWLKEGIAYELLSDADLTIADSYMADEKFYQNISKTAKIPVYIDDNKRLKYPAGIVVNGMIYAKQLDYPESPDVTYLLGSQYAILRKEFALVPEKRVSSEIESVLLVFGGNDTAGLTPRILNYLNKEYPYITKNVIIGTGFQNRKEIESIKDLRTNFIYDPDAETIRGIMLKSDIAISAGGQTLHELARIGVPTIGICVADNQRMNVESWQFAGFLEYIGWYDAKDLPEKLENAMSVLTPAQEREKRSRVGRNIIDGKGAERIISSLLPAGIGEKK